MASSDNVIALINSCLRHIQKSSSEFDSGDLDESFRLSTEIISLLCDDGKNYHSLLHQIEQKSHIPFLTSVKPLDQRNLFPEYPLVMLNSYSYPFFLPKLGKFYAKDVQPLLNFKKWWNENIFMGSADRQRTILKRGDLVREYRNARGSHKGDEIRSKTLNKIVTEGIGWYREDRSPLLSIEKAMIRQIAWEVENSILFPFACLFPFKLSTIIQEDVLLISKRPYITPSISYMRNSGDQWLAKFHLKNWGGADCRRGRVAVAYGHSMTDLSWVNNNEIAQSGLDVSAQCEDVVVTKIHPRIISLFDFIRSKGGVVHISLSIEYFDPPRQREVNIFSILDEIKLNNDQIWPFQRINKLPKIGILQTR